MSFNSKYLERSQTSKALQQDLNQRCSINFNKINNAQMLVTKTHDLVTQRRPSKQSRNSLQETRSQSRAMQRTFDDTGNSYQPNNSCNLANFLQKLKLENYLSKFQSNQITMEDIPLLTKQDLVDLKLPIGPRSRLWKMIQDMQIDREETNDEPCLENYLEQPIEKEEQFAYIQQMLYQIQQQQLQMMKVIEQNQKAIARISINCEEEENQHPSLLDTNLFQRSPLSRQNLAYRQRANPSRSS